MYFFRGSKYNDEESPKASKHKSVDNLFTNLLARSISKRNIASSPERVPRKLNEFDTPSFLSRSRSTAKGGIEAVADRLYRSRSSTKRISGYSEEKEGKADRSKSSTKRHIDWFGGGGGGGGGDGGSSRSRSTSKRNDKIADGWSSKSKNSSERMDQGADGGSTRSRSSTRRNDGAADGGSTRCRSTTKRNDGVGDGGSSRSKSTMRCEVADGGSSRSKSTTRRPETGGPDALSRTTSRRSAIPIVFSNSTGRAKPPTIERTLDCTLEDLLFGCVKKVTISRDVLASNGLITQEQEKLKIKVQPGWRQGTRITFEGKCDEKQGTMPADVVFSIAEARHSLYQRDGDDLIMSIEIPLVKALTGCTLSIPLLGGEKVNCKIDEIVSPGYEKIIKEQGMPCAKDKTKRGDLRIQFHVAFPVNLSREQRWDLFSLLKDS